MKILLSSLLSLVYFTTWLAYSTATTDELPTSTLKENVTSSANDSLLQHVINANSSQNGPKRRPVVVASGPSGLRSQTPTSVTNSRLSDPKTGTCSPQTYRYRLSDGSCFHPVSTQVCYTKLINRNVFMVYFVA